MNINFNTNVELVDGDFLRVKDIIRDTRTMKTVLRGWLFRRTEEMNGLLERKINEICWILDIDENDKREPHVQGMKEVSITEVRKRRLIRMTNQLYPQLSWREDGMENPEVVASNRVLVCRYKYVCVYVDANARNHNKWCEKALLRLRKAECDQFISTEDEALRHRWRGETLKGGSWKNLTVGERERQCDQNPQPSHVPPKLPCSGSSKARRENLSFRDLHGLQTLEFASGDGTTLRDSSEETMKGSPEPFIYEASVHQPARKFSKHKTGSENYIDLTADDTSLDSQASSADIGDTSKASNIYYAFNISRPSSEVIEVPSPTTFSHRIERDQRREAGQINSSWLNGGAGKKRFVDPMHWSEHRASKRINTSRQSIQQRYTFGDCFCGAGGASRGAVQAGLHLNWGFDFNLAACQSYKMNFPSAKIYNVWAHDFVNLPDQDHDHDCKVDICHLSPPCQFFSNAHTIAGTDDEMNTATLFSVAKLLEKARPRVVTLEQTAGLLRRHALFFNALVLMFTELGFSIRWRLLQCADYGLPQHRLRLFMIASW